MTGGGRSNIILCGFMGSGKTTYGTLLAKALDYRFADLDDMIEAREGMSIPEIFDRFGEAGFRDREHQAAAQAVSQEGLVLATGGGTLTYERNVEVLRSQGTVAFLNPGFPLCWSRIRTTDRPLVQRNTREQLEQLYRERERKYRSAAHVETGAAGSPSAAVAEVRAAVEQFQRGAYRIRDGQAQDVDCIMDLWLRSTVAGHPFIPRAWWESKVEEVRERYLPAGLLLVCESGGRVQGFLSLLPDGFISAVFAEPDLRGRGIGSALLGHVMARRSRLSLAVYRDNEEALAFYRSRGFHIRREALDEAVGCVELILEWTRPEA